MEFPNNKFTPEMFKNQYSQYYLEHESDSPSSSREFLVERIIENAQCILSGRSDCTMFSLGAGRQIVEAELQEQEVFKIIAPLVNVVTADIATLDKNMLLSNAAAAIQADGQYLPFADESFDMVYSNMAVDFMPRTVFPEIERVLRPRGIVLINFHHPNLIAIAQSATQMLCRKIHTLKQKIRFSNKEKYREQLSEVIRQKVDAEFVLNNFPYHIFHSVQEIQQYFSSTRFEVEEITEYEGSSGENGWFYLKARKKKD